MASEIWDAYATLNILHRDDITMTCVGKAISRGNARCRWVLPLETAAEMHVQLRALSFQEPGEAIPKLRELARLGLCEARHEYQVNDVVEDWTRLIGVVELRMELEAERRERRRLERLFTGSEDEDDEDDDGDYYGGGDSSPGGNGGQYSFSDEVSDRQLLQVLEEAERQRRSLHYSPSLSIPLSRGSGGQYSFSDEVSDGQLLRVLEMAERQQETPQYSPSLSIPRSDERFSPPTAPFSEYQPSTNQPSTPPATPPEYATEAANAQALERTILSLQQQFEAASRNLNQQSKHESVRSRLANIPIVKKQSSDEENDARQARIVFETKMMQRLEETERQRDELQAQLRNNRDRAETGVASPKPSSMAGVEQKDATSIKSFPDIRSYPSLSPTRSEALRQEFQNEQKEPDAQSPIPEAGAKLRTDQEISTLETELSSLRLQLQGTETRLTDLEIEHTVTNAELNGQIAACREEISQLRGRLVGREAESVGRGEEIEDLGRRLGVLDSLDREMGETGERGVAGVDTLETEEQKKEAEKFKGANEFDGHMRHSRNMVDASSQVEVGDSNLGIGEVTAVVEEGEEREAVSIAGVVGRKLKGLVRGFGIGRGGRGCYTQ